MRSNRPGAERENNPFYRICHADASPGDIYWQYLGCLLKPLLRSYMRCPSDSLSLEALAARGFVFDSRIYLAPRVAATNLSSTAQVIRSSKTAEARILHFVLAAEIQALVASKNKSQYAPARAARHLRGIRHIKSAPPSRSKSQVVAKPPLSRSKSQVVWAGNDSWRRAPPTSRSFTKPRSSPRCSRKHQSRRSRRGARARADGARPRHGGPHRALAEVDEMVVRGALPRLSSAQGALVDWNLRSENGA